MELVEALAALAAKETALQAQEAEITKLKSIKEDVVSQRDDIKNKYSAVEGKFTTLETQLTAINTALAAEKSKREEVESIHLATLKTTQLRKALEQEGVTAMDTALKLIDLSQITVTDGFTINNDVVTAIVTKLKETDGVLFGKPSAIATDVKDVPAPKRASEGEPKAGFAEELKNCKTAKDVETLLRKHGKM